MKKLSRKILMMILSVIMLFSVAIGVGCDCSCSCNEPEDPQGPGAGSSIKPTISISMSSTDMIVGDYLALSAYTNKVLKEDVVWSTENSDVVAVDEFGYVEAIGKGTANIVAKYGEAEAKCAITVDFDESLPEIIDLAGFDSTYTFYKGKSFVFQPAIKYRGRIFTDGEFVFTSYNENAVTFDGNTLTAKNVLDIANCPLGIKMTLFRVIGLIQGRVPHVFFSSVFSLRRLLVLCFIF